MLILCGLVSTQLYADVKCGAFELTCWNCPAIKVICEGGKMGAIGRKEKPTAIKVEVVSRDNQIRHRKTLNNPPNTFEHYHSPEQVNQDQWIEQQLLSSYTFERGDRIIISPTSGFVFNDNTTLYKSDSGKEIKYSLGSKKPSSATSESSIHTGKKFNIICEYSTTPQITQSTRCSNEISCIARVHCSVYKDNSSDLYNTYKFRFKTLAMCRADGKKCPEPSQCMLDSTQHFLYPIDAENAEAVEEYKIDKYGGASHERTPITIGEPKDAGSGSAR